jgi:hypothetical protein
MIPSWGSGDGRLLCVRAIPSRRENKVIEKVILLFLFVWAIATIFYQFKATADFVGKWNYFSLIPKWTFFAPHPKTTDYQFCYQDLDHASASPSEPVVVEFGRPVPGLRFIWNPNKRNTKAFVDVAGFILTYVATHKRSISANMLVMELYVPYLLLLNYVSCCAPPPRPNCRRRFLVFKMFGYLGSNQPMKIFESNFHAIEP